MLFVRIITYHPFVICFQQSLKWAGPCYSSVASTNRWTCTKRKRQKWLPKACWTRLTWHCPGSHPLRRSVKFQRKNKMATVSRVDIPSWCSIITLSSHITISPLLSIRVKSTRNGNLKFINIYVVENRLKIAKRFEYENLRNFEDDGTIILYRCGKSWKVPKPNFTAQPF